MSTTEWITGTADFTELGIFYTYNEFLQCFAWHRFFNHHIFLKFLWYISFPDPKTLNWGEELWNDIDLNWASSSAYIWHWTATDSSEKCHFNGVMKNTEFLFIEIQKKIPCFPELGFQLWTELGPNSVYMSQPI